MGESRVSNIDQVIELYKKKGFLNVFRWGRWNWKDRLGREDIKKKSMGNKRIEVHVDTVIR